MEAQLSNIPCLAHDQLILDHDWFRKQVAHQCREDGTETSDTTQYGTLLSGLVEQMYPAV
jgi:hypothetical protein